MKTFTTGRNKGFTPSLQDKYMIYALKIIIDLYLYPSFTSNIAL